MRVKDLDFERMEVRLRRGKGGKDRVTMLPSTAKADLMQQLRHARALHQKDLTEGAGHVALPDAIARKYPNSPTEWGWQFVFPATGRYFDREAQIERRHHLHETVIQKAVRNAAVARESRNTPLATVCATVWQHISWKAGTTFERYRSLQQLAQIGHLDRE